MPAKIAQQKGVRIRNLTRGDRKTGRKTGRGVRKIEVAEGKSQTCGEQRLAETGVAQWNLPDQSTSSEQRTADTGMNNLPSSQWPSTSDETPAQDTGVLRKSSLISWA